MFVCVDAGMSLFTIVSTFGQFLKDFLQLETPTERRPPVQSAFDVLMSSQWQLALQQYPDTIDSPRNRKDKLSNAIIAFFKKERLCWTSSEVAHGVAKNTTKMLTDALWFLDGHQATFCDRSCDIPVVFDQFTNFNCPELSKHRKRSSVSLSSECVCVCCVGAFCACGCV